MSNIEFVRFRSWYENVPPMVDVKYKSGRLVSLGEEELPRTVKAFLSGAKARCCFDKVWGFEILYTQAKEA
jgi:hypothetical protein